MLEPIPEFSKLIQAHLRRTEWGDFPDVVIHADESLVKKHPFYPAAKHGAAQAARQLVLDTITIGALEKISALFGTSRPSLMAVHALETEGMNVIPRILAQALSKIFDLRVINGVLQINRVTHTGADGYRRLAAPALFDGRIEAGEYFLVDDFIGQGGTLTNLKGFIESHGGKVTGATTLTGKAYSAKLWLTPETLQALREKHGNELEEWWITTFGYGFERLTESEARYLARADDAHAISTRIIAAGRDRN